MLTVLLTGRISRNVVEDVRHTPVIRTPVTGLNYGNRGILLTESQKSYYFALL
jgi:hypothetical protein